MDEVDVQYYDTLIKPQAQALTHESYSANNSTDGHHDGDAEENSERRTSGEMKRQRLSSDITARKTQHTERSLEGLVRLKEKRQRLENITYSSTTIKNESK